MIRDREQRLAIAQLLHEDAWLDIARAGEALQAEWDPERMMLAICDLEEYREFMTTVTDAVHRMNIEGTEGFNDVDDRSAELVEQFLRSSIDGEMPRTGVTRVAEFSCQFLEHKAERVRLALRSALRVDPANGVAG